MLPTPAQERREMIGGMNLFSPTIAYDVCSAWPADNACVLRICSFPDRIPLYPHYSEALLLCRAKQSFRFPLHNQGAIWPAQYEHFAQPTAWRVFSHD